MDRFFSRLCVFARTHVRVVAAGAVALAVRTSEVASGIQVTTREGIVVFDWLWGLVLLPCPTNVGVVSCLLHRLIHTVLRSGQPFGFCSLVLCLGGPKIVLRMYRRVPQ